MRLSKGASRWRTKLIQEHHLNKYQQRVLDSVAGIDEGMYKRFYLAHRAQSIKPKDTVDSDALVANTCNLAEAVGFLTEEYARFATAIAEVMAETMIYGSDDVIPTGLNARLQS